MRVLFNFLCFQVGWFLGVGGAAGGYPWLGPLFSAIWLPAHVLTLKSGRRAELALLGAAAVLGWIFDSLFLASGWAEFPEFARFGWQSPLWMVVLWVNLAATLRGAMGWIRERYLLSVALGVVAGPLAYWAGVRLGALELLVPELALGAIAVEWAIGMPTLLLLESWTRKRFPDAKSASAGMELS